MLPGAAVLAAIHPLFSNGTGMSSTFGILVRAARFVTTEKLDETVLEDIYVGISDRAKRENK